MDKYFKQQLYISLYEKMVSKLKKFSGDFSNSAIMDESVDLGNQL